MSISSNSDSQLVLATAPTSPIPEQAENATAYSLDESIVPKSSVTEPAEKATTSTIAKFIAPSPPVSEPTEKPTTPPRISFGVEIEFLVAYLNENFDGPTDPDEELGLPPVVHEDPIGAVKRLVSCLLEHGIPVKADRYKPVNYDEMRNDNGANAANSWVLDCDPSVNEYHESSYRWTAVEIASPASYAYGEAFEMIQLVVNVITTNFRTRINTTCGLHVHVGNGQQRLDMRAARNYAALLWSADPLISTLHCPGRGVAYWSKSIRRTKSSNLAKGKGAADAFKDVMLEPAWPSRYSGRARKLGEAPVASRVKFLRRLDETVTEVEGTFAELDCESDDSDLETASKPFYRPRKTKKTTKTTFTDPRQNQRESGIPDHVIPAHAELARLDACRVVGGPPQVNFPVPEGIRTLVPSQPNQSEMSAGALPTLERPYQRLFERRSGRFKQDSIGSIVRNDEIMHRLHVGECLPPMIVTRPPMPPDRLEPRISDMEPERTDTWSGVRELLSCDVGTHQVTWLMNGSGGKHNNSNWNGHCTERLNVLPGIGQFDIHGSQHPHMTVENREAMGSLDGDWIATWARINCRLLEWARDSEPAVFMKVLALIADEDGKEKPGYDIIDLLYDIGAYKEALHCEKRLQRREEAWYECILVDRNQTVPGQEKTIDLEPPESDESFVCV
ncbi:Fc.00g067940.m01.CDS01 [Cosmosporella sp. VM-42]